MKDGEVVDTVDYINREQGPDIEAFERDEERRLRSLGEVVPVTMVMFMCYIPDRTSVRPGVRRRGAGAA